jgi:hypothetical protein
MSEITLDTLTPTDFSLNRVLEDLNPILTPTDAATQKVAHKALHIDPTIATVKLGAEFENTSAKKLRHLEAQAEKNMDSVDLLLDLSQELATMGESLQLTAKTKDILQKLKNNGISLLDGTDTVTKEQLIALKSSISLRTDKLRTQVQQIFTKVQTAIQYMSSINDTVKKMISEHTDFMRKISERSVKR